jgi:hypothetical protein
MKSKLLMVTLALVTLCLLCTAGALGQTVGTVLNSQPVVIQVPSHPGHASQKPMAQESSLLGTSAYTFAIGEQPLWQFAPAPDAIPLGDIARLLKSDHKAAKKADVVWEN